LRCIHRIKGKFSSRENRTVYKHHALHSFAGQHYQQIKGITFI